MTVVRNRQIKRINISLQMLVKLQTQRNDKHELKLLI